MSDLQGVSANTAPLLYADECRLSREAVALLLSTHRPDLRIEPIAGQMARMSRCSPAIPFLLISDIEDPDVIIEAFRLGARGYITTAQSWAEAAEAIQFVASGGVAAPWKSLTALDRLDGANSIR